MTNENMMSNRDRQILELTQRYESATAQNQSLYLEADEWCDIADWYGDRYEYDKAIEVVEKGLRQHPDDPDLQIQYAYFNLDNGNDGKAREIVENISENYLPEVKLIQARLSMRDGKPEEAEQFLDSIEDKEDLMNVIDAARIYLDAELPDKALEWLDPVKDKYAKEQSYKAALGTCYQIKGLTQEALAIFNDLIDEDPYSANYWYGAAKCHFDNEDYDKAIEACDYALVGDENFTDALILKGNCFICLKNEEAAIECFQKARVENEIPANFVDCYKGLSLMVQSEWSQAYEYLEAAIQNYKPGDDNQPPQAILYSNAGYCLSKMGESEKAHLYCKKAQEIDPKEPEAYLLEGRIYFEEDDCEKGFVQFRKALEREYSADICSLIGEYSMENGYYEHALNSFKETKRLNPDFKGINEKLASLCMLMRDKENFLLYNRQCKNPINAEKIKGMLEILKEKNDVEVVEFLQQIIDEM